MSYEREFRTSPGYYERTRKRKLVKLNPKFFPHMSDISDSLKFLTSKLKKVSPTPLLEAELLISYALNKTKEYLVTNRDFTLSGKQHEKLKVLLERRLKHEPIAYLSGKKEFYGLEFEVNKNVLIPRPETELLVEKANLVALMPMNSDKRENLIIHDLATGSGCIIISIANELKKRGVKNVNFEASDISEKALKIARKNAEHILGKRHKIHFKKIDVLKAKEVRADLLISNPPYIPTRDIKKLEKDVKNYEPKTALDGGKDGLKFYKKIFGLIKGSSIHQAILEIHSTNISSLKELLKEELADYKYEIIRDLSNRNRVLHIFS